MTVPWAPPIQLKPCNSRQCNRQTSLSSQYCCGPCADAWEATPRYEPHAHVASCDERHTERGPTNWFIKIP